MSVRGSLRTMSVEDVLGWIDRSFVCGSLAVERGAISRTFHFDSGYVTGSSSNDPAEHLGQLLMSRGFIDAHQLEEAFRVQADTGVLLGKILIMVGAVTEERLREVLEEKVREGIAEALSWVEGEFRFDRAPEEGVVSEYEISVNLRAAIEAGERRAAEWRAVREVIPNADGVLWVSNRSGADALTDDAETGAQMQRLLDAVEKGLTVNQIVLELNGRRFQVTHRLAALVESGVLSLERRAEPRVVDETGVSASDLAHRARLRAAEGARAEALALAEEALARQPESAQLQKLHRELERSVFAELSRDFLSSFRVPRLLKSIEELAALELSDAERYLAGRVDGRWDLLSLMRISPLREVEALITFKRLADRGIISLS
jgi:hypothetical protein